MEDKSIKELQLDTEQEAGKQSSFSPLALIKLIGDHPITIAAIYGLMLYFLPPMGWFVMLAVMGSVFAHEGGHFLAAKLNGAPVTVFSVGLPSKWTLRLGTYGGTSFQLTPYWFMGGYVDPDMRGLPYWRMSIIMLAGVMVNLLIAFTLFGLAYLWTGKVEYIGERPVITELSDSVMNAKIAGFKVGDEVLRVNEKWMESRTEFVETIKANGGKVVYVQVDRDGHYKTIPVLVNEESRIGASFGGTIIITPSMSEALAMAVEQTGSNIVRTGKKLLELSHVIEPESQDPDKNRMHGIVAVVEVGTAALKHGVGYFLFVIASVNTSLFFVNLVPLPILDGGQLVMIGIQKWRDRAFHPKIEAVLIQVCIYFFVGLMLLSLYNDFVHRVKF